MSIDHGKLIEAAKIVCMAASARNMLAIMKGCEQLSAALAQPAEAVEGETDIIRNDVHRVLAEGDGYWQACSGCHETNQGYETGLFPYSETFKCHLGSGCTECGGLGAIWFEIPTVAELEQPADAAQGAVADGYRPIETDAEMGRHYIPLPGGWEVQTKGNGSTFRICDPNDEHMPITGHRFEHEELERMARAVNAEWLKLTTHPQAAPAQGDGCWPATKEEMEAYWEAYSAHRVHGEGEAIRAGLAAYQALRAAAPSQEGES